MCSGPGEHCKAEQSEASHLLSRHSAHDLADRSLDPTQPVPFRLLRRGRDDAGRPPAPGFRLDMPVFIGIMC